jgi:hypothetical protein
MTNKSDNVIDEENCKQRSRKKLTKPTTELLNKVMIKETRTPFLYLCNY